MTRHHWPPGTPAWIGDDCLVPRVVDGSHLTELVATYDHELGVSLCPECGDVVAWEDAPDIWADPRCPACQADDESPATLRTGES
jgi:rubredoxin